MQTILFVMRSLVGVHPRTGPLLRFGPMPYGRVLVEPGMAACIEGLPRCANTFGALAFLRQNPDVRPAHHMHMYAQVALSIRFEVPCVVLIREPIGQLTSIAIAGNSQVPHGLTLRWYIDYMRRVMTVRSEVALCDFPEVLADPAIIATRLNERFGTDFTAEAMDEDEKRAILTPMWDAEVERPHRLPAPSESRDRLKPAIRAEITAHRLLPVAQAAYEDLARTLPARSADSLGGAQSNPSG